MRTLISTWRKKDEAIERNEIEVVYPMVGEGLLEFLHRYKVEDSEVMLCPRCSVVFDNRVVKKVESSQETKRKENWRRSKPEFYFNKRIFP